MAELLQRPHPPLPAPDNETIKEGRNTEKRRSVAGGIMVGIAFAGSSCGLGGRPDENKALKKHKEIRVATRFPTRLMIAQDTRELGRGSPAHFLTLFHLYPSLLILSYLFPTPGGMETPQGIILMRGEQKAFPPLSRAK